MRMTVNEEIRAMMFEHDLKTAEAKSRLKNIRRIRREKLVQKILESMKLNLENKQ